MGSVEEKMRDYSKIITSDKTNYRKTFIEPFEWPKKVNEKLDLLVEILTYDPSSGFVSNPIKDYLPTEIDLLIHDLKDLFANGNSLMGAYDKGSFEGISEIYDEYTKFSHRLLKNRDKFTSKQYFSVYKQLCRFYANYGYIIEYFLPKKLRRLYGKFISSFISDMDDIASEIEKKV